VIVQTVVGGVDTERIGHAHDDGVRLSYGAESLNRERPL
jgi:hypothetical protein